MTGIGYDAATGNFIMTDWDPGVWSVTPGGVATRLSTTKDQLRGLVVTSDPVPPNGDPTAVDDAATMTRDAAQKTINVTSNDTDPEEDLITIDSVTQPANGTVVNQGPSVSYAPNPDYCNDGVTTDDFTYTLTGGSTATVSMTVTCDHRTVYGVSPFSNGLQSIDRITGQTLSEDQITIIGGKVTGTVLSANALAVDPKTGRAYTVLRVDGVDGRVLAKVDLLTGEARTIRNTKRNFSSLTFAPNGKLYGLTGRGDPDCAACLYKLAKKTGDRTKLAELADNNCCGQIIGFNPLDGNIYHAYGSTLEKFLPKKPFTATQIPYSGGSPNEAVGLGFDPVAGNFIMTEINRKVWSLTPNGDLTLLSSTEARLRGVVIGAVRTLTLGYSAKQRLFAGQLSSPEASCVDGRTVSIFRARKGPDAMIGDAVTEADGSFELSMKAKKGKHYATVDAETTTRDDCAAARSKSVKVR